MLVDPTGKACYTYDSIPSDAKQFIPNWMLNAAANSCKTICKKRVCFVGILVEQVTINPNNNQTIPDIYSNSTGTSNIPATPNPSDPNNAGTTYNILGLCQTLSF